MEVTEHVQIDDYSAVRAPIAQLRHHGIKLAVDDAGSGYSSLQHIVALGPDIIKLDRSLIEGVDHDTARRALITGIVLFALESAAIVVAEEVETQPELDALIDLAVDAAQGYLLGPPTTDPEIWQHWEASQTLGPKVPDRPTKVGSGQRTPALKPIR